MSDELFTDSDVQSFVDVASDKQIKQAAKARGLTPYTRRLIVLVLGVVALAAIVAELWLSLDDKQGSEALITLAATAIGAIGGMAVPNGD